MCLVGGPGALTSGSRLIAGDGFVILADIVWVGKGVMLSAVWVDCMSIHARVPVFYICSFFLNSFQG